MLSFIAGGAGGIASGLLLQRSLQSRRDNAKAGAALTQLDQVDGGVKGLNEKLTKLEATWEEGIHRLSRTLESKINPESVMDTFSASLKIIEQHIIKIEEMVKRATGKKEDKQIDLCISNSDQAIEIHNNQPRFIIIDTNATVDGRIFTLLESDLLEELRGRVIIAECMTSELEKLKPELSANGFNNLWSFQSKDKGRIDHNNYESKVTDARLLQLTSGTDDKELFQDISDTDKKLLLLTSDTNGILITQDLDLVKCCRNKNIRVLNLNELNKITQEQSKLQNLNVGKLIEGELQESAREPNDAIIKLRDHPVIVVKDGGQFVGQTKFVSITGAASNGRTLFAKVSSPDGQAPTLAAENPPRPSPAPGAASAR